MIGTAITFIRLANGWGLPGVTPEQMQQFDELGMNPALFAILGVVCGLFMNVLLPTAGGAILAAVKSD